MSSPGSPSSSSFPWQVSALPLPARSLLLDALELPDVVRLLSCNRALRSDHETAALALRGYDISRHFGRGCTLDWCLPVPAYLLSDAETQESCALDHADEPPLAFERWGDTCVKLLSLTGQMGYALDQVLYRSFVVDAVAYTVLPFIWPTTHDESTETQPETELDALSDLADHLSGLQLAAQAKKTEGSGVSSRVTPLALHFENIELSPGSPHACCKFCQMVEERVDTYTLEGFAYLLHRDTTVIVMAEQLRAEGHGEDSDEWAAAVAHFERLDTLYDQDVVDEEDAPEIMRRLIERDELPTLRRMEALALDAGDDIDESELLALGDAVGDAAHADFTDRTCRELCVPLRRFFETGGFRDVRHETVDNPIFASVERIAGTAPCGFVAGMVIVSGSGVGTVAY